MIQEILQIWSTQIEIIEPSHQGYEQSKWSSKDDVTNDPSNPPMMIKSSNDPPMTIDLSNDPSIKSLRWPKKLANHRYV